MSNVWISLEQALYYEMKYELLKVFSGRLQTSQNMTGQIYDSIGYILFFKPLFRPRVSKFCWFSNDRLLQVSNYVDKTIISNPVISFSRFFRTSYLGQKRINLYTESCQPHAPCRRSKLVRKAPQGSSISLSLNTRVDKKERRAFWIQSCQRKLSWIAFYK